jgi:adenosylcobyric acid synthase
MRGEIDLAKAIMIQGTASNAGKSLMVAGLCRIFSQDGYSVAPFKSQNMALNSFITEDGLEMGRAQVVQAEAAYKSPDVRMNPILIKPTSDKGSQIVLNGRPMGNMSAAEYYEVKKKLLPEIKNSYESLAAENDIIVIEGAGSPAEINLNRQDFVNMGMAKMAKAPVFIVGDIDRGGVFASLYGTVMLLNEEERSYVKGTVINKFRGDINLLKPGLEMLHDLIQIPVAGVIPYLTVDIDDEDSLSEKFTRSRGRGLIDIAIIKLPRISNFTDFNAFEHINEVDVRYISSADQLKDPDLIIIPGTKNTMGDLKWLRETGLETLILKHAAKEKPVFGICGGYQMLCERISDPCEAEHGGQMNGIGLIKAETVFENQKVQTRVSGIFQNVEGIFKGLNGKKFEGYEIHMGRTFPGGTAGQEQLSEGIGNHNSLCVLTEKTGITKADGISTGNVYGSYVHGLFDSQEILNEICTALMEQKGVKYEKNTVYDAKAYKEQQYDLLAETLRKSLDMKFIYEVLEKGI